MNKQLRLGTSLLGSEQLSSLSGDQVKLFVCGPTVYGPMHLGHGKTYTQLDLLATVLKRVYPHVRYAMNLTDVDDKIINKAIDEHKPFEEVALFWEDAFWKSMERLGNSQVTEVHRATDFMDEIISQVERLISKNHAYVTGDGSVYFDGSSYDFPHGRLHRVSAPDESESRLAVEFLEGKRSSEDFAVWKSAKPGEPSWDSPWGKGRPGWHIEDTAITETVFGEHYEIHGGATDLIFPHHEAEIAQMEALSGIPLVDFWVHTGLLEVDGKKMGKSLHNFKILDELLDEWEWRTVRFAFLRVHYGSTMNLDTKALEDSAAARQRVENYYLSKAPLESSHEFIDAFWEALLEDLNTPKALGLLFDGVRAGTIARDELDEVNSVLGGVFNFTEETTPESILRLVEAREEARQLKQWEKSDALRQELSSQGWHVRDTPSGPFFVAVKA